MPPLLAEPPADTRERILDATLACIARVGYRKTTLDDVAREAGCARATLYRHFPGKQPLMSAVVAREASRVGAQLAAATADCPTLDDALCALIATAVQAFEQHAALQYVLTVEPEVLLPYLSFGRFDGFLRATSALIAPVLAPFVPPERAERAAEWLVRIVCSYACSPSEDLDPRDPASVRALITEFVRPGLVPPTMQGVSS